MLQCLRIKNLAVIEDLTWELEPGFNILTGETGAGKSILIDAFNLLLGERADKTLIRDGADSCTVEAALNFSGNIFSFLSDHGLESLEEDELLLKRTFTQQGQNRQFINGSPATLQTLKKLGDLLVDIHGPHDHQSLLSTDAQLGALDAFGKIETEDYHALYREQLREEAQLEELKKAEEGDWQSRLEFLEFQINEIEQANLKPEEEETLEREYQLATHGRRIAEIGENIRQLLGEGEQNVYGKLETAEKLLQEWEQLDFTAAALRELNRSALIQLRELETEAQNLVEKTELDAERLQQIEERINLFQSLKRKHGRTVADVLSKLKELRTERDQLAGREETIARLEAAIQKRTEKLEQKASELTKLRKKCAPKLSKDITAQLRALGFKRADFSIQISALPKPVDTGKDAVEFLFAPNPGESARPLRSIASSGEMARVMLAVKTVLARQDQIPILIFDEIDANVGGETAVAVGQKLGELAGSHQVLCITHLPQVAAAGHAHFCVQKKVQSGRTKVFLKKLGDSDRVEELSRMLGSKNKSANALAESMLAAR